MARPTTSEGSPSSQLSPFQAQPRPIVGGSTAPYAGTTMPPAAKNNPSVSGLLYALKRRWVLASFIGLLVAVLAGAGVWLAMPGGKHTVQATVEVRTNGPDLGKRGDELQEFLRKQPLIIRSRDVLNRTLAEPSVASLNLVKEADDAIRLVEEGLVVRVETPTIYKISFTTDAPDEMKTLMGVLLRKYLDDANLFDRQTRDRRVAQLASLYDQLQQDIQRKDRDLKRLIETNETTGASNRDRVSELQTAAAKARAELIESKKQIEERRVLIELFEEQLRKGVINMDPIDVERAINVDPRVAVLMGRKGLREDMLSREKRIGAEADAPVIIQLTSDIKQLSEDIVAKRAELRPEIESELRGISKQLLQNRISQMKAQQESEMKLYEFRDSYAKKLDGTIKQNNLGDHEIDALRKELEPERDYLRKIREQQLMYDLDKSGEQRVRVMEETYISRNQNLNKKLLLAIGTALGSFVFVVLVVGLLEWRNRRIDGVDQVVNDLGMRIIGTVPAFPSRANIKAASEGRQANWRFILNESINSTRTMLLHSARNQQMQVVMITSATQGEGKTSLASQLGTSMATAGMRTLIVDCDLRNPSINKLFDLKVTPGVSEVLMQEVDVSDAVQPTSVPNLWVIPAGQCSNRVIAALAQGHPLETLFNRLRGQFDFILVDSCPVLPVADALLIGQHVDGVLFSIMQDVSQIPKVISASEKLAQLNILLLGAVVNGIRNDVYSYGYNYVKQLPA